MLNGVLAARVRLSALRLILVGVLAGVASGGGLALDPGRQINQYGVRTWGPEDGLPTGTVRALAQTADGGLWIGTDEGLCRFDGVQFERPAVEGEGDLQLRRVSSLAAGPGGELWVGTRGGGLLRWSGGVLRRVDGELGRPDLDVTAVAWEPAGALWVGSSNRGVYRLKANVLKRFGATEGLPGLDVAGLRADPQGGVWVSLADGSLLRLRETVVERHETDQPEPPRCLHLALRDRQGRLWTGYVGATVDEEYGDFLYSVSVRQPGGGSYEVSFFQPGSGEEPLSVTPILEDRQGLVWFGSWKGVVRVKQGKMEILSVAEGLPDDQVSALLEDQEGNIWIGTRLGVCRLQDNLLIPFTRRQGLRSDRVLCACNGADGSVWVGTDNGLNKIETGRAVGFKTAEIGGAWVYDVLRTADGALYLATRKGVFLARKDTMAPLLTRENRPLADSVHALCLDSRGVVWIGTSTSGVFRYRGGGIEPCPSVGPAGFRQINDLACGPDGTVWAATRAGLARVRGGVFEPAPLAGELAGRELNRLHLDQAGTVWAGTAGNGLVRYRGDGGKAVTSRQGLWHDTILCVLEDGDGALWLSSPQGVFRVKKSALEAAADDATKRVVCEHFGVGDGMPTLECLPGGCRSADGRLWFCTIRGLCMIQPENLATPPPPPRVQVIGLQADNQRVPLEQREFAPGVRDLEFRFAAFQFRSPEKILFRCCLDGFDRRWTTNLTERRVRFSALPPGAYTFRVQSCRPRGEWGGDAVFSFTIRPFLWQRTWFQVLALVGLAGLVLAGRAGVVRFRLLLREWRLAHCVGPYRLLETVGKGGMGTVWRAVHRRTGQEAAVKILDVPPDDAPTWDRFVREGLACERIHHPAVVRVFERGDDRGRLWYAMEFCHGKTLRRAIGSDGLPGAEALDLFRRLFEAVRAIHDAGVTHRDLKPDNILLTAEPPGLKILDFGLARLADHRTRTGAGLPAGTLAYLPPEYLGSGGREDGGVDFYALGIILYEMLTGAPPFAVEADDPAALLYAVLNESPVPPAEIDPAVPEPLSTLALRLIDRDPARRLKDPAGLAEALAQLPSAPPA